MRKLGQLHLESEHFVDEANKTVGAPAISPELIRNRRHVTSRVNELGKTVKTKVIKYFKTTFDLDITLHWSKKAGCSMCPCSPGFIIRADREQLKDKTGGRLSEDYQIRIWGAGAELNITRPKYGFMQLEVR